MSFMHFKIFDPELNSKKASTQGVKKGIRYQYCQSHRKWIFPGTLQDPHDRPGE